jgi:hypothetical protein
MTREDPLDVLERIHRDVKLLAELAGPAIRVTIEAATPPRRTAVHAPAEAKPTGRAAVGAELPHVRRAREFDERVASYLAAHPNARQSQITKDLGSTSGRVVDALKRLGGRVERGEAQRAPGQAAGRPSPTWKLKDSGSAEGEAAVDQRPPSPSVSPADGPQPDTPSPKVTSAIKPRIVECVRNLDRPTFGAIVRELYPGAKLSRNLQPAKAVATLIAAMEEAGELLRDGTYRGGVIYRLATDGPVHTELPADPDPEPPALSPRIRKSIARAEAEAEAEAERGDPPPSAVFDLLRDRNLTIREIAAQLGEHQAVIAEEVHGLKPWLEELHEGKLRVVERYRRREAA